jgi:hypothetical protein
MARLPAIDFEEIAGYLGATALFWMRGILNHRDVEALQNCP